MEEDSSWKHLSMIRNLSDGKWHQDCWLQILPMCQLLFPSVIVPILKAIVWSDRGKFWQTKIVHLQIGNTKIVHLKIGHFGFSRNAINNFSWSASTPPHHHGQSHVNQELGLDLVCYRRLDYSQHHYDQDHDMREKVGLMCRVPRWRR